MLRARLIADYEIEYDGVVVCMVYLPQVPDREHLSVSKLGVDMPPLPLMSFICHTAKDLGCFVGLLLMT